ncbi:MAG: hypothetical protein ACFFD4_02105 [Candidatus Odinarchaeota archaeon]
MNIKKIWATNKIPLVGCLFVLVVTCAISSYWVYEEFIEAGDEDELWTEYFNVDNHNFSSVGRNEYFILEPGYQLTLEGKEGGKNVELVITVLNETEMVGNVETRIVEERESVDGEIIEISKNFFAICNDTKTIFYFGETVDMYKNGQIVSHEGAWRADSGENKAGVMMPGLPLLGSRYYQEIAPGVAKDRAEILKNDVTLETPAGTFEHCLKIVETTPLQPGVKEYKVHAPGIGIIKDANLLLTSFGFI